MTNGAEGLDFGDDDEPAQGQFSRRGGQATRPTHKLSVKERNGKNSTTTGVGWLEPDGTITIKLGPCVVLTPKDDVHIKLFPVDRRY